MQPDWSPDGRQIAFMAHREGKWDIFVMNADDSNQRKLTILDQEWYYKGWINAWTISTEIRKTKGGLSGVASPCGCELVSSSSGGGGG